MKMWNKDFSKRYHSEELIEKKYVLMPAITDLIKSKKWRRMIDLGCGSGYYCRKFAKKDVKIVGVDKNMEQLDIAISEEAKKKLGIQYIKSDITKIKSIKSNSFDIAMLNFVIVEIHDESTVKKLFKEAHRILRKDGLLIIGQVHPHHINRSGKILEKTLKNKGSYFNNTAPAVSKALLKNGKYLIFKNDYHYTLEFLLNSLSESGFMLEKMKELSYNEIHPTHIVLIEKKV